MARMLNLTDVFELIGDGFNTGAFAQREFVGTVEQAVVHVFAQLGDQLKSLGDQQLLRQWLRRDSLCPQRACPPSLWLT